METNVMNIPLSENEVNLKALLSRVSDRTLWGYAVKRALQEGSTEGFRQLLEQLRSQAMDNHEAMESIIGREATAVLIEN